MIRALIVTVLIAAAAGLLTLNFAGYRRAGKSYTESEKKKRQTLLIKSSARYELPAGFKGVDNKKCR